MSLLPPSKNRKILTLTTLLVLLLSSFPGPASAQDGASASPRASQYNDSSGDQALDVGDVPPAVSENVADGTGSVNEAASGTEVSSDPGAASGPEVSSAPQTSPAASSTGGTVADPTGQGMTALPETGGVSPPAPTSAPWAVESLLGCVLLVRSGLRRS
jgi:hypothetical protein